MATYATKEDIRNRMPSLTADDSVIDSLLDEAGIIIDAYNEDATSDKKKTVSVRMVSRALSCDDSIPVGTTQGNRSALGYSEQWTMANGGTVGELYLNRIEKKLLGYSNKIGSYSPVQELVTEATS